MLNKIIKIVSVILSLSLVLGIGIYLFIDNETRGRYQVQMDNNFLEKQINRLLPIDESDFVELSVKQDGFKGILRIGLNTGKEARDSMESYKNYAKYLSEFISLPQISTEVLVWDAEYTSILEKIGYGWFHRDGNLYAEEIGKEEAKGKPNYRNSFAFTILKNDNFYNIQIFCNKKSAEEALKQSITQINLFLTEENS